MKTRIYAAPAVKGFKAEGLHWQKHDRRKMLWMIVARLEVGVALDDTAT